MDPGNITQQTRRLARNVKWLSLQELLIRLIGLATAIYLARVLSPSAYGSLGLALAIIGILSTLVQAGTGSRATRLTALHPDSVPVIYTQTTGLRIVMAVIVFAALLTCVELLSRTFSLPSNLLILCSFLLLRPTLTVAWAFHGLDQMHVTALADIAEKALLLGALLILVKGQGNDLLWVPVLETLTALAVVLWLRKRLGGMYPGLSISFNYKTWPGVTRESLPLGMAALLGSVYLHGAILLLGWLDTSSSAADFLVAQKLMLTMTILLYVINSSAFPSISRLLSTDVAQALNLVSSLLRYYLVLIIPVIFLLAVYANEILNLLFGASYANSGPVLMVLLLALPFMAVNHSLLLLLRAIPKPRTVLMGQVLSTFVLIFAAVLLIPRFGATGAAAAVVAGEASGMVLLFWLAIRIIGSVPLNTRCFAPLIAGLIVTLIFLLMDDWSLFLSLPLAALLYMLALWSMKAISADEIRALPQILSAALHKDTKEQKP